MAGYYDVVLGAIPVALLGITGSLTFATDLALTTAVTLGAIVAVALICHALFVNGPVDAQSSASTTTQSEAPTATNMVDAD